MNEPTFPVGPTVPAPREVAVRRSHPALSNPVLVLQASHRALSGAADALVRRGEPERRGTGRIGERRHRRVLRDGTTQTISLRTLMSQAPSSQFQSMAATALKAKPSAPADIWGASPFSQFVHHHIVPGWIVRKLHQPLEWCRGRHRCLDASANECSLRRTTLCPRRHGGNQHLHVAWWPVHAAARHRRHPARGLVMPPRGPFSRWIFEAFDVPERSLAISRILFCVSLLAFRRSIRTIRAICGHETSRRRSMRRRQGWACSSVTSRLAGSCGCSSRR